ncbi:hypothetical protein SARC_11764 [Sphaeroforma arctica JP610]|uniref:Uncharacterized protein n=1 Tax=Sphaeroforma arctica JP610 TaxID=667725 RepID=A0A0L0FG14_9EUKA|nr:hypothetical protein SARC_11764 [Sphaeroforma arctica JP610]KNC75717.1 hypothetical protein SARC_11764 [Sphaeroforma arctica JP610]|eukprot:XP_014149619.1 hypothetical protein SARC_11764 [Sphaeroforma arctica JP610]
MGTVHSIQETSDLAWQKHGNGYNLTMPHLGTIHLMKDATGRYHAELVLKKVKGHEYQLVDRLPLESDTLASAFAATDSFIKTMFGNMLPLLGKNVGWMRGPASPGQIKFVRQLLGRNAHRMALHTLTRGRAAEIITSRTSKSQLERMYRNHEKKLAEKAQVMERRDKNMGVDVTLGSLKAK